MSPYAGETELADPLNAGEFAADLANMAASNAIVPWCTYVGRKGGTPVGIGGFKSSPDSDGIVEIGYLTFIPAQRQGVATMIAGALVDIAVANGARIVRAHTQPEANPSTRVLAANEFMKIGDVVDPEDGPVWRWERILSTK